MNSLHDEGRIYLSNSNIAIPRYQFFITDHLGNTRVIIERQSATTAVFQTTDYGAWGEILENVTGATTGDWKIMLYQGNEYIDFAGYNTYDFHARQYDPFKAQFNGIDPVDNYSLGGTVAMNNNPLIYTDRSGRNPLLAIAIGAAIGALTNVASQVIQNGGFNNWSWGSFALSTAIGGATGALGFGLGNATAGWGTVGGGIATGAGTGFVGGGLSDLAGGGNFWQGAWNGALWGGAVGGAVGFFKTALTDGRVSETSVDANMVNGDTFTESELRNYISDNFGNVDNVESTLNTKINLASQSNLPDGYFFKDGFMTREGSNAIGGVTKPYASWFSKAGSKMWIAGGIKGLSEDFVGSQKLSYLIIGHELIHAFHYSIGLTNINFSERSAYSWNIAVSNSMGLPGSAMAAFREGIKTFGYNVPNSYSWRLAPFIQIR